MCSTFCQCYNYCNPLNTSSMNSVGVKGQGKNVKTTEPLLVTILERENLISLLQSGVRCSRDCQCSDCSNQHNETTKRNVISASSTTLPKKRKRSNPDQQKGKVAQNMSFLEDLMFHQVTEKIWKRYHCLSIKIHWTTWGCSRC